MSARRTISTGNMIGNTMMIETTYPMTSNIAVMIWIRLLNP